MKNSFSVCYSPRGSVNISPAGPQNQAVKGRSLHGSPRNLGTSCVHKLLSERSGDLEQGRGRVQRWCPVACEVLAEYFSRVSDVCLDA